MKLKIVIDGRAYDVEVEAADDAEAAGYSAASLPSVQSAVLPAARGDASSDLEENKVCRSPLAGVVSRLQVNPGQQVQANDLLLVLEAMKMEIKITAQLAGTVKSIEVRPGNAVKANQVLVSFQ